MKNSQWAGSLSLYSRKYLLPLLHGVFKGPVEESKALSDYFADAGDKCDEYYFVLKRVFISTCVRGGSRPGSLQFFIFINGFP